MSWFAVLGFLVSSDHSQSKSAEEKVIHKNRVRCEWWNHRYWAGSKGIWSSRLMSRGREAFACKLIELPLRLPALTGDYTWDWAKILRAGTIAGLYTVRRGRGRCWGASGWLYAASGALAYCRDQRLSWGTPTTVKTALREALLAVVAKCLGSLPCCPSVVAISHLHALFLFQVAPGINASSPRSRMSCCAPLLTHRPACEWQLGWWVAWRQLYLRENSAVPSGEVSQSFLYFTCKH